MLKIMSLEDHRERTGGKVGYFPHLCHFFPQTEAVHSEINLYSFDFLPSALVHTHTCTLSLSLLRLIYYDLMQEDFSLEDMNKTLIQISPECLLTGF